jgi:hypothetical protein
MGSLWFIAASLFIVGICGAFLIGRNLSGLAELGGIALWLLAPLIVIVVMFAGATDPTLTQQQAGYNYAMAVVITSIGTELIWLPVTVIGALVGRARRKRRLAFRSTQAETAQ